MHDYKGVERKKKRLMRKQEQVWNQLDAQTQLFQKVYYNPKLTLDDETVLRDSFFMQNETHNKLSNIGALGHFLGYFPLTYAISRTVRPTGVLIWTAVYYFGIYRNVYCRIIDNAL